jgi:hypothetical protein
VLHGCPAGEKTGPPPGAGYCSKGWGEGHHKQAGARLYIFCIVVILKGHDMFGASDLDFSAASDQRLQK